MAKRNPYWGKQRGKLGETVLSVNKGVQVQRAYNANPVNPKTKKQTGQRIVFACAVKFFKAAIEQQFKFAFEDKKQKESDYNAFMRHNINIAGGMIRSTYESNFVSGYGPFMISNGSLAPIACNYVDSNTGFGIPYGTVTSAPTTLQAIGNALKTAYNLRDGDIITIVHVVTGITFPNYEPSTSHQKFNVLQFKIGDTSDTRTIASVQNIMPLGATTTQATVKLSGNCDNLCGVIVSRPTPAGLLVSTCELTMDVTATGSYDKFKKGGTRFNELILDWGATQSAVLEGGLLPGELVLG